MPGLSFFADEIDLLLLIDWLNQDPEIVFIIESEGHEWVAVPTVTALPDGDHSLWHTPTAPIPPLNREEKSWVQWVRKDAAGLNLCSDSTSQSDRDEFMQRYANPGRHEMRPFLGNHPAEIRLELCTRHRPYSTAERLSVIPQISWYSDETDLLPASGFQWIRPYGAPAGVTDRWWRRLKYWVSKQATPLTPAGQRWSFWAFPSARQKLKDGMRYYSRGWDLSELL